ncbi:MAG: hypothetical protein VYE73_05435 [Acidobacteriota bacterium]|nr:hypothetical protein [Acidobacteriota bacterium]
MKTAPRIGFRREVLILVPTSLFVLMVVAIFTALSYRGAVQVFVAEAQDEAAVVARLASVRLARDLAGRDIEPDTDRLRSLAPGALGIAYLDSGGRRIALLGDLPAVALLALLPEEGLTGAIAVGPNVSTSERIVAIAPMGPPQQRTYLRIDFPDRGLARESSNVRILTILVIVLSSGVGILSVLFLRHFLAPFDTLVERARAAVPTTEAADDDIPFLLETFDNA